jgi:hypothetical protein
MQIHVQTDFCNEYVVFICIDNSYELKPEVRLTWIEWYNCKSAVKLWRPSQ